MDKLKEQLAVLKQHSFWIMCGGILLVCVVTWYMTTGKLASLQTQYQSEITSNISAMESIRGKNDHPNQSTSKGMDLTMAVYGEDVYNGWLLLAKNQESVLVWPPTFANDPVFMRDVADLRPIELKVAGDSVKDQKISEENRRLYRNFILEEIPRLADPIKSKWHVKGAVAGNAGGGVPGGGAPGGSMPGGGAGPTAAPGGSNGADEARDKDDKSLVIWNPANQRDIVATHFGFAANIEIPTTLQVLYAQEDLWVLENIMSIIAATNGDAQYRHDVAIKYIDSIKIGRGAIGVAGQVTANSANGGGGAAPGGSPGGTPGGSPGGTTGGSPGGSPGGGMSGASPGGMAGGMPGGMAGASPGGAPGGSNRASVNLADGRYVDTDYQPVDAARLVSTMKGQGVEKDRLLAIAKRVPVRLQFKMDQRRLSLLLAECGNSKLPMEVRQIRVNKTDSGNAGGGGGGAMPGGGGGGMPGGGGGGGMPGGSSGMLGSGDADGGGGFPGGGIGGGGNQQGKKSIAASSTDPNEITVQIYGIVYLYNPPDRTILGLPEGPAVTTTALSSAR